MRNLLVTMLFATACNPTPGGSDASILSSATEEVATIPGSCKPPLSLTNNECPYTAGPTAGAGGACTKSPSGDYYVIGRWNGTAYQGSCSCSWVSSMQDEFGTVTSPGCGDFDCAVPDGSYSPTCPTLYATTTITENDLYSTADACQKALSTMCDRSCANATRPPPKEITCCC